jgi:hypothetical protein
MENSSNKAEINCTEVVRQLEKLKVLFAEYESALDNPDIRDNLPVGIKLGESVEAALLKLEEIFPIAAEQIESLKPFLEELFQQHCGSSDTGRSAQKPSIIDPKSLDIEFLKSDENRAKFGEYTLNPECLGLDFEKVKIKVLNIQKEIQDSNLTDLAQIGTYIINKYSDKYIIPDLSFCKWIIKKHINFWKGSLGDYCAYYCFGSILHKESGEASVLSLHWEREDRYWLYAPRSLVHEWSDSSRVVLLERGD